MASRTGSKALTCFSCQWRSFSVSYRRLADKIPPPPTTPTPAPASSSSNGTPLPTTTPGAPAAETLSGTPKPSGPLANAPRSYGKALKDFAPTPLGRPIGMSTPPKAGENTGIETRTLKQRRDDFVDYKKHLVRREQLKSKISRPYFRDWRNMQFHKGKTFLSPPRLFKADLSLYFPNLHGRTLNKGPTTDTTPVLEGRASVVTIFSSRWAENQAKSFTSPEANPVLHEALSASGGRAQLVQINVEEDALKSWIQVLFNGSLRRTVGKDNWGRYFLVRKGISDEIKEHIGLLNSKVGYTYLVDYKCRIRWAGSGNSEPEEREGLVKGVQRILDEMAGKTAAVKNSAGDALPAAEAGGKKAI
ncbi:ATP10 protein-domain-containing protein [Podospora didyma]|uniref:ATP10 protein-domain-containing protein n=1 Tax=Podospora didyma TaxID=330526 RepID=A0AAE0P762_9PEZI|nr:ATP10 protein-domain-containing protein [Podospora didyma]